MENKNYEFTDEELEMVSAGTTYFYIKENDKGLFTFTKESFSGDKDTFIKFLKGEPVSQMSVSGGKSSLSVPADKVEEMKKRYIDRGYIFIE